MVNRGTPRHINPQQAEDQMFVKIAEMKAIIAEAIKEQTTPKLVRTESGPLQKQLML